MEFKDRIKAVRMENEVSPAQLAAHLNKSESAVRAWEIERSKPDADTLIKLAKFFNCTTDYLLGLSDHKNSSEKADISTLSDDVEETLLKIDNGKRLLEGLVRFLNVVPEKDRSYITSCYLEIAQDFALVLNEIYRFHADCEAEENFDFTRVLECCKVMSKMLDSAKHNLNSLSYLPIWQMLKLASEYGSNEDYDQVNLFLDIYQNTHSGPEVPFTIKPRPRTKTAKSMPDGTASSELMKSMSRLVRGSKTNKYNVNNAEKTQKGKPPIED